MPRSYRRKNVKYAKPRRSGGKKRKNDNMKKMLGHVANKALDYAKNIPGPVGVVARGLGMVKSFINVESHYLDTPIAGGSVGNGPSTTFFIQGLNAVTVGTGFNNRIGQSILNKSISINWSLVQHPSATITRIKLVLLMDKKPDVGVPTFANVFSASAIPESQIDAEENGDRFVILKHEMLYLTPFEPIQQGKMYVDLSQTHTIFDAATVDFEKNALYIMGLSNEASNTPGLIAECRFRYYDN